jgi:hypothetical protein
MKRYDPRLWIGGLLILGGILVLLENLHYISNVGGIFWGLILGAIGVYFLYRLFVYKEWWAAFPGFILVGLALSSFLPESLDAFKGLAFFGGLSVAFVWVYVTDRTRWWAIIPAGVMLTLGTISVLDDLSGADNGGILFVGLGLTFILLAILPGGSSRSWALIPGTVLLVFGVILGTPFSGFTQYLWPVLLILLGGYFVFRFFRNQSPM